MTRAFAALVSLAAACAFARAAGEAVNQTPIELPKFVVTDTRELPPPEQWRYATIPGFEILTNASDKATQRLVRDFQMFRQALGYVWPLPARMPQTTSLILCGRKNKFDDFIPAGKSDHPDTALASLFLKSGQHAAIVIDLEATTLNVLNLDDSLDAATGTDSGLVSVEHDKQLYREYVHYLLSGSEPRLPAWFEEGLAQIIMKMQFDKRWIEFAKLEDPNTVSAEAGMVMAANAALAAAGADTGDTDAALPGAPADDRDFQAALFHKPLVPLDKFFAVAHDSPEALNPLGNNRWAKQAYAFVHMCLYGYPHKMADGKTEGKYARAFATFLARSTREPVTEEMFKECFKMSYKQMLLEIRGYCDMTVYTSINLPAKKGQPDLITPPPPLALRDATESEVGRIKGGALLLADKKDAARLAFIAPYTRGERDPNLLASLGLFELTDDKTDRARKFLEAACAGKTRRAEAYYELARMRHAEALTHPAGGDSRLSAAQTTAITSLLLAACKLPPLQPATFELLAETWLNSVAIPPRMDLYTLVDGVRLYPGRLKLVYETAALAGMANELPIAHSLAEHGIKYAPDPAVKERFAKLKASFPPEPPATPSAAAQTAPAPVAPAKK